MEVRGQEGCMKYAGICMNDYTRIRRKNPEVGYQMTFLYIRTEQYEVG